MTQINVVQVHRPSFIYSEGDSKYNKQADKSNEGNTSEANIEYSVHTLHVFQADTSNAYSSH